MDTEVASLQIYFTFPRRQNQKQKSLHYAMLDHRLFVVDILTLSLVGYDPPKIVRAAARRLNTTIPKAETNYLHKMESLVIKHRIVERLNRADFTSKSKESLKINLDAIDNEQKEYMLHAEKNCRKIHLEDSGENGILPDWIFLHYFSALNM